MQHVTFAMHKCGLMLDFVSCQSNDDIIHDICPLNQLISNHNAIFFSTHLTKPDPIQ